MKRSLSPRLICHAAMLALLCLLLPGKAAAVDKYTNTAPVCYSTCPPDQTMAPYISLSPTDCSGAADSRTIYGRNFREGATIGTDSIFLNCGGSIVNSIHGAITMTDDSTSTTNITAHFSSAVTIQWDPTDFANLPAAAKNGLVWCTLTLTATTTTTSDTWSFPNAYHFDTIPPDVTTPANFVVDPIVPLSGGRARVTWRFNDPMTPGDPDGTCSNSTCNGSDSRYQYQWFRAATGTAYDPAPIATVSVPAATFDDQTKLADQDRYQETPAPKVFCYKGRARDTGGNSSVTADADEQCITPDSKDPVFQYVIPYKDSAFTTPLVQDNATATSYVVTSNPCFFATSCTVSASRTIYLKIIVSEPLFDENNKMGYTMPSPACTPPSPGTADDGKDNDCNGYVDEWPNNKVNSDRTNLSCPQKNLYNYSIGTVDSFTACFKYPVISISGPDNAGMVPSTYNPSDRLTYVCSNLVGSTGYPNALCTGWPKGTTIYRYAWDVSGKTLGQVGGVDEGTFDVKLTGTDSVGNVTDSVAPTYGKYMVVDNTGPTFNVGYFSNVNYTTPFRVNDHDNNSTTPAMPLLPAGKAYIRLNVSEIPGATPSMWFYTPTAATPTYMGTPSSTASASNPVTINLYQSCAQPTSCDWCTGANCVAFAPDSATSQIHVCKTFNACYTVTPGQVNDGYAAISVDGKDRYGNKLWQATTVEARVDPNDANGLTDDTVAADGKPTCIRTWGTAQCETDAAVSSGQFFAFDTHAPTAPVVSLPITPCDNSISRSTVLVSDCKSATENSGYTTSSVVKISWSRIGNNTDDDDDGSVDEEYADGVDNDSDGLIDEDTKAYSAAGTATGTASWEIAFWRLQVATSPDFATESLIVDQPAVTGTSYTTQPLPQRPLATPYYWRVAAWDWANNQGGFTPPMANNPYFTFGIDTEAPKVEIKYFRDASHTVELIKNSIGIPVTGDTADNTPDSRYIYVTFTSDEPLKTSPTFKIRQNGRIIAVPNEETVFDADPASQTTTFSSLFIVDAKGADAKFTEGFAEFLINAKDVYGNSVTDTAPSTGSYLFVDAKAPTIQTQDITITPNPAGLDTNDNGVPGEATDYVKIQVAVSEYLMEPFRIKVTEQGTPDPCASCTVTMTLDPPGTNSSYTGYYVVGGGNGSYATIKIGDTDPSSVYRATDFANNPVFASTVFTIDTTPPINPFLLLPTNGASVKDGRPQTAWRMVPRTSDLSRYIITFSTSSSMVPAFATASIADDGKSSTFYYRPSTEMPDGHYYWGVIAVDKAFNRSGFSTAQFYIDRTPPLVPTFDAQLTPTTQCSSPLSGTVNKPNSKVTLFVNGVVAGSVFADGDGKFNVGIDEDDDGLFDEDPYEEPCGTTPQIDNDGDGLVDEDPIGVSLQNGVNVIEGMVTDPAGNQGPKGCGAATPFYNATNLRCELTRDSGPPTFQVVYFNSSTRQDVVGQYLPMHPTTNKSVAKAGPIYLKIYSSKPLLKAGLPNPPTISFIQQGATAVRNQPTTAMDASGSMFQATYTVRAADNVNYIDGEARIVVIGEDSQGNKTPPDTPPDVGANFIIDTAAPSFDLEYFKEPTFDTRLPRDENLMPISKARAIYLRIITNEIMATSPYVVMKQGPVTRVDHRQSSLYDQPGFTEGTVYQFRYDVPVSDGGSNVDGITETTLKGTDIAGNTATDVLPVNGAKYRIDTTPPQPPLIILPTETVFTQVQASGVTPEPYLTIQAYIWNDNDPGGMSDMRPSGTAKSGTPPANQFVMTVTGIGTGKNNIAVRSIDLAENEGDFATPAARINNTAPVRVTLTHTFTPGWNLISFPFQPVVTSPDAAIGVTDGTFCRLSTDGDMRCEWQIDAIEPGKAYWGYLTNEITSEIDGITSNTTVINLVEGWNMIAVPYNYTVAWNGSVMKVSDGFNTYRLNQAEALKLIDTSIYKFDGSAFQQTKLDTGAVEPWTGFMVRAKKDCALIFPTP